MNQKDWPTYEIELPGTLDMQEFTHRSSLGIGGFWLVLIEARDGFFRFTGVVYGDCPDKPWARIKLDITKGFCYVTIPNQSNIIALEIAKQVMMLLRGLKLFHEGAIIG